MAANPVHGTKVPPASAPSVMNPFTEEELEDVYTEAAQINKALAEVILVLGWTGLRWSELRALQPRDVTGGQHPALHVRRAQPEGAPLQPTKTGHARRVPVADRVSEIVATRAGGDGGWLFAGRSGGQLNSSNVRRNVWRQVSRGRTLRELRHTAACIWLTRGVDVATVSSWLGHASLTTTHIYVRYLGTRADAAAVELLSAPVHSRYTEGGDAGTSGRPPGTESGG